MNFEISIFFSLSKSCMKKDVSNFDMVFTEEEPVDSFVDDSNLSKTVQDQFNGISFLLNALRFSLIFTDPLRVFI
jgi:hypothetical protein